MLYAQMSFIGRGRLDQYQTMMMTMRKMTPAPAKTCENKCYSAQLDRKDEQNAPPGLPEIYEGCCMHIVQRKELETNVLSVLLAFPVNGLSLPLV